MGWVGMISKYARYKNERNELVFRTKKERFGSSVNVRYWHRSASLIFLALVTFFREERGSLFDTVSHVTVSVCECHFEWSIWKDTYQDFLFGLNLFLLC